MAIQIAMEAFRIHTGKVAVLDRANVDTDQIIPKQFLKRIERTGFGEFLFYDWRFLPSGEPNATFPLNDSRYEGASVLVTGKNFGCGSSREHAPWALGDYGFRAIIAESFADIFANNCRKNGILPVVISEAEIGEIIRRAHEKEGYAVTVDLVNRKLFDSEGFATTFIIDDFQRHCLLEGLDDIGLTLEKEPKITSYEIRRPAWLSLSEH